jgi:site-specific DNA recombinase
MTNAPAHAALAPDASVKMARYRAALDAGGDPDEIGKWISEAKVQRLAAEAELCRARPTAALTRQQVQAVIEQCADVADDLRGAEPANVAGAYRKLGLRLISTRGGTSCKRQQAQGLQI